MTYTCDEPAILFLPEHIDTNQPCLWWCIDPEDVYTVQENAVCKATLASWDDVGKAADLIANFQFILVCAPPGPERDEIVSELTNRLMTPILIPTENAFYGTKNVRELLESKGAWAVNRLLYGATEVPIQGILDLADVELPKRTNVPRVMSGIKLLDFAVGGFEGGELSVWTGKTGEGKSTLLGQILLEAIQQNHNVCAYSGELKASKFKKTLVQQAAGHRNVIKKQDERSGKEFYEPKPGIEEAINEWWRKKFYLTDIRKDNAHDEDNILRLFEYAYRRYGCKVFLVDNIMMVQLKSVSKVGLWQAQSSFVGRLSNFAKANDVHVHLVAHPKKIEGDRRIQTDDVEGSGGITKKCDNLFKVERIKDDMVENVGYSATLTVLKNRDGGSQQMVELEFDKASNTFYQKGTPHGRVFSWEREMQKRK